MHGEQRFVDIEPTNFFFYTKKMLVLPKNYFVVSAKSFVERT